MNTLSPEVHDFARRLIALEASRDGSAGAAGRVCDRLRGPLARLGGIAGFLSLLSRSLALAKAEVGSLDPVRVREDGSLDGLDTAGVGSDSGLAIVTHLLGLLVTLVGEPLTRQLVRDAWPEAAGDETDARVGGQP